jgi:hypothetical protein
MDLRKEILKEHSKKQRMKVVDYVGDNRNRFKALIQVFLEGPYRVTQRASWPISYCVENSPGLITPHLSTLLTFLKRPGLHNAVKRNVIRLFQFVDIPKRMHGRVAEVCFQYLQDKKEPVAIRVFSMSVLAEIALHNPDLKRELRLLIEDHLPYASAAFLSRARKVIKALGQES